MRGIIYLYDFLNLGTDIRLTIEKFIYFIYSFTLCFTNVDHYFSKYWSDRALQHVLASLNSPFYDLFEARLPRLWLDHKNWKRLH